MTWLVPVPWALIAVLSLACDDGEGTTSATDAQNQGSSTGDEPGDPTSTTAVVTSSGSSDGSSSGSSGEPPAQTTGTTGDGTTGEGTTGEGTTGEGTTSSGASDGSSSGSSGEPPVETTGTTGDDTTGEGTTGDGTTGDSTTGDDTSTGTSDTSSGSSTGDGGSETLEEACDGMCQKAVNVCGIKFPAGFPSCVAYCVHSFDGDVGACRDAAADYVDCTATLECGPLFQALTKGEPGDCGGVAKDYIIACG